MTGRQIWLPGDLAPLERIARLAQLNPDETARFARAHRVRIEYRAGSLWIEARAFLDRLRDERIEQRRRFEQVARRAAAPA